MTTISIPKMQRALVMQGGGSLGAYELGVFKALYEELPHRDNERILGQIDKNTSLLFDILAGTSIGAINAPKFWQTMLSRTSPGKAHGRP